MAPAEIAMRPAQSKSHLRPHFLIGREAEDCGACGGEGWGVGGDGGEGGGAGAVVGDAGVVEGFGVGGGGVVLVGGEGEGFGGVIAFEEEFDAGVFGVFSDVFVDDGEEDGFVGLKDGVGGEVDVVGVEELDGERVSRGRRGRRLSWRRRGGGSGSRRRRPRRANNWSGRRGRRFCCRGGS